MCTVTLSYDQNNALARRKLKQLLATGLFFQSSNNEKSTLTDHEEEQAHRKEVEEFLYASKIMAAQAFARHL